MTITWERKNGQWISRDMRKRQDSGLGISSHLAWVADSVLHAVALKDGMKLTLKGESYELQGVPLGEKLEAFDSEQEEILVQYCGDGLASLSLRELGTYATKLQASMVRMAVPSSTRFIEFSHEAGGWISQCAPMDTPPPSVLTIASLPTEPQTLPIRWTWKARCIGYFSVGRGISSVPESLSPETRNDALGLVLDTIAPADTRMALTRHTWQLVPYGAVPDGSGHRYLLHASKDTPVTVKSGVEELRDEKAPSLHAPGFAATSVEQATPLPWPQRYAIAFTNGDRIFPSVENPEHAALWDYGPLDPLAPGIVSTYVKVRMMAASNEKRNRAQTLQTPALKECRLPAPFDLAKNPPGRCIFLGDDKESPEQYGVLVVAQDIPEGEWRATSYLPSGEQRVMLSWRGFVDWARTVDLQVDGKTRSAVVFEKGLELDGSAWIAAPFVGVAMLQEPTWWASVQAPTRAVLTRAKDAWWVRGDWLSIDLNRREGRLFYPGSGDALSYLCLIGVREQAPAFSGPLLFLDANGVPRLKGWVTDECQFVTLPGGIVKIGGPPPSGYRLEARAAPDSMPDVPAAVRAAFEHAIANRELPEGSVGRVSWRRDREDNSITADIGADAASGVFVLSEQTSEATRRR
jgi:hypothetical protein